MAKTILQRVMAKIHVREESGCWVWTGAMSRKASNHPYGHIKIDGRMTYTHRLMYELFNGQIKDGMQIDHVCRNTVCCNPSHLEQVSSQENTVRGANAKTHCVNGHEWVPENHLVNAKGHRRCKLCSRDYFSKWSLKQKTLLSA